jgi:integrase
LKLPQLALDQIGTGTADEYCFAGRGGKEMSGFSKLKVDLDRLSGVGNWVLHDLRRTAASGLQELGTDHMVIEAILNHAVVGVAGHYLHATLDRAKGEALQRWATELERIVGSQRAAR